jgi:hypothetical protein
MFHINQYCAKLAKKISFFVTQSWRSHGGNEKERKYASDIVIKTACDQIEAFPQLL